MMKHTIAPTNGRPKVQFEGELLAAVNGRRNNSDRWAELKAYKTNGGKWIIEQIGHTLIEGEQTFVDFFVFDSESDMTAKIGSGRLAEKLWMKLGIETITIL